MTFYHINRNTGRVNKCFNIDSCNHATKENHYISLEEAKEANERNNKSRNIPTMKRNTEVAKLKKAKQNNRDETAERYTNILEEYEQEEKLLAKLLKLETQLEETLDDYRMETYAEEEIADTAAELSDVRDQIDSTKQFLKNLRFELERYNEIAEQYARNEYSVTKIFNTFGYPCFAVCDLNDDVQHVMTIYRISIDNEMMKFLVVHSSTGVLATFLSGGTTFQQFLDASETMFILEYSGDRCRRMVVEPVDNYDGLVGRGELPAGNSSFKDYVMNSKRCTESFAYDSYSFDVPRFSFLATDDLLVLDDLL